MARNRQRKTERGNVSAEKWLEAVRLVKLQNMRQSEVARLLKTSTEEEWYCEVCQEPYSISTTDWVKCIQCTQWSHYSQCVENVDSYLCSKCE